MNNERRSDRPRRDAIDAILRERLYQTGIWADDKKHTAVDWTILLLNYLGKLSQEALVHKREGVNRDRVRKRIRQIGAICVAALEEL